LSESDSHLVGSPVAALLVEQVSADQSGAAVRFGRPGSLERLDRAVAGCRIAREGQADGLPSGRIAANVAQVAVCHSGRPGADVNTDSSSGAADVVLVDHRLGAQGHGCKHGVCRSLDRGRGAYDVGRLPYVHGCGPIRSLYADIHRTPRPTFRFLVNVR
jgi:hypothetical protein